MAKFAFNIYTVLLLSPTLVLLSQGQTLQTCEEIGRWSCGQACTLDDGSEGMCQTDGVTCGRPSDTMPCPRGPAVADPVTECITHLTTVCKIDDGDMEAICSAACLDGVQGEACTATAAMPDYAAYQTSFPSMIEGCAANAAAEQVMSGCVSQLGPVCGVNTDDDHDHDDNGNHVDNDDHDDDGSQIFGLLCSSECQTLLAGDACTQLKMSGADDVFQQMSRLTYMGSDSADPEIKFGCECLQYVSSACDDESTGEACCAAITGTAGCLNVDFSALNADFADYKTVIDSCAGGAAPVPTPAPAPAPEPAPAPAVEADVGSGAASFAIFGSAAASGLLWALLAAF